MCSFLGLFFRNKNADILNFSKIKYFGNDFSFSKNDISQPTITCSKLTIETLEQGVKYVQSKQ